MCSSDLEAVGIDGSRSSSSTVKAEATYNASSVVADAAAASEARSVNDSNVRASAGERLTSTQDAAPNLAMQRWVAAQPGVKIGVKKEGIYRVMRAELQAAGFNLSSNSANWRLFVNGNEQAIIVGPSDQYIEFYGKGIDTIEADTQQYYLVADTTPGLRMGERSIRPIRGNVVSTTARVTLEKRERTGYVPDIINGDADNWWGRVVVASPAVNVDLNVPNVDTTAADAAILTVRLFGYSLNSHQIQVVVNGHTLSGFVSGSGQTNMSADFVVPANWLFDGNNQISLNTTSSGDFDLFDRVSINYRRRQGAYQNQTSLVTPNYKRIDVGGFSSPTLETITLTDGPQPVPIDVRPTPASNTAGVFRVANTTVTAGEVTSTGNPGVAREIGRAHV